ncbi:MAG: pseudouridine synthase [Betaproteobacteria bacterium]
MKAPDSPVLPTRNGVGPSCIALPPGPWPRVIDFLAERFDTIPAAEIAARMARGDVLDATGEFVLPGHAYRPHARLYYYRSIDAETRIPFDEVVLFEDEFIVVADKPHFLPVTPGGRYLQETLLVRLKRRLGLDTLAPMHRIDRETAGLVLFTKQPPTRGKYQEMFSQRVVAKRYQAIAPHRDDLALPMTCRSRIVGTDHFMRMQETGGAANAETRIELLEARAGLARYRLLPVTGKRHQLRVQMAALGVPILNDQIYPAHLTKAQIEQDDFSRPLQLLAEYVAFHDPVTGAAREFESRRRLSAFPPGDTPV